MNKKASLFIDRIADEAVNVCAGTRLFPSLMIAQACLESNYGQSKLSSLHNNYFGIKGGGTWKGGVVNYNTNEYLKNKHVVVKQPFRTYPTLQSGFADRVKFLQVNPRYAKNGVFASRTPAEQAEAFLRAGYATDPLYPQKLIGIIAQYDLTQFDKS
jgi:flagellum-specific peptidoglycan hydrolase FlgJ